MRREIEEKERGEVEELGKRKEMKENRWKKTKKKT